MSNQNKQKNSLNPVVTTKQNLTPLFNLEDKKDRELLQQIKNNAIDLGDKELVMASDIESVFPCYFRLFEAETKWLNKNKVNDLVNTMCGNDTQKLTQYQAVLTKIRDPKEKLCNYTHNEIMIMCDIANEITTKINAVITEKDKNTLPKVLLNGDLLSARPLLNDNKGVIIPCQSETPAPECINKPPRSFTVFNIENNNDEQNKESAFQKTIDKIKDTEAITKACADFLMAMNDALNKDALKYGREILKNDNITLLEACDQIFNNSSVDYKQKKEFLKKMNFYNIGGNHDLGLSCINGLAYTSDIMAILEPNRNPSGDYKIDKFKEALEKEGYKLTGPFNGYYTITSIDTKGYSIQQDMNINEIDKRKIDILRKIPLFSSLVVYSKGKLFMFKHTNIFISEDNFRECLTKNTVVNPECLNIIEGKQQAADTNTNAYYNNKENNNGEFSYLSVKNSEPLSKILKQACPVYGHNGSFLEKILSIIGDVKIDNASGLEEILKKYTKGTNNKEVEDIDNFIDLINILYTEDMEYKTHKKNFIDLINTLDLEDKNNNLMSKVLNNDLMLKVFNYCKEPTYNNLHNILKYYELFKRAEQIWLIGQFPKYKKLSHNGKQLLGNGIIGETQTQLNINESKIKNFILKQSYPKIEEIFKDNKDDKYIQQLQAKFEKQICIDRNIVQYHDCIFSSICILKNGALVNKDLPFPLNQKSLANLANLEPYFEQLESFEAKSTKEEYWLALCNLLTTEHKHELNNEIDISNFVEQFKNWSLFEQMIEDKIKNNELAKDDRKVIEKEDNTRTRVRQNKKKEDTSKIYKKIKFKDKTVYIRLTYNKKGDLIGVAKSNGEDKPYENYIEREYDDNNLPKFKSLLQNGTYYGSKPKFDDNGNLEEPYFAHIKQYDDNSALHANLSKNDYKEYDKYGRLIFEGNIDNKEHTIINGTAYKYIDEIQITTAKYKNRIKHPVPEYQQHEELVKKEEKNYWRDFLDIVIGYKHAKLGQFKNWEKFTNIINGKIKGLKPTKVKNKNNLYRYSCREGEFYLEFDKNKNLIFAGMCDKEGNKLNGVERKYIYEIKNKGLLKTERCYVSYKCNGGKLDSYCIIQENDYGIKFNNENPIKVTRKKQYNVNKEEKLELNGIINIYDIKGTIKYSGKSGNIIKIDLNQEKIKFNKEEKKRKQLEANSKIEDEELDEENLEEMTSNYNEKSGNNNKKSGNNNEKNNNKIITGNYIIKKYDTSKKEERKQKEEEDRKKREEEERKKQEEEKKRQEEERKRKEEDKKKKQLEEERKKKLEEEEKRKQLEEERRIKEEQEQKQKEEAEKLEEEEKRKKLEEERKLKEEEERRIKEEQEQKQKAKKIVDSVISGKFNNNDNINDSIINEIFDESSKFQIGGFSSWPVFSARDNRREAMRSLYDTVKKIKNAQVTSKWLNRQLSQISGLSTRGCCGNIYNPADEMSKLLNLNSNNKRSNSLNN